MLNITKPTLLLDEDKCRSNIRLMAKKAKANDLLFRPHFKTHQSLGIGRWFKDEGVESITVSSLGMAEYFAGEWKDITLAFPVNILEIDRLNTLASKSKLNLLVESEEVVLFLNNKLNEKVGCFIKIDAGYGRTGIPVHENLSIEKLIKTILEAEKLHFRGLLVHDGHTYDAQSSEEILRINRETREKLAALKEGFKKLVPDCIASIGDTPGCSVSDDFSGIDEIRPGNFVFYDLVQSQLGACSPDQIAIALACPVVAVHANRSELIIYGGGIHFSKEFLENEHGRCYGRVVNILDKGWGTLQQDLELVKLSQEHGTIRGPAGLISMFSPGDLVYILPVHSCMTANLFSSYTLLDGSTISRYRYA